MIPKMLSWQVYQGDKLLDTVQYASVIRADDVRQNLIDHDGLPEDIRVHMVPVTCRCGRGKMSAHDFRCGHCRTKKEQAAHTQRMVYGK